MMMIFNDNNEIPLCLDCKDLNNEIDEETGYMKCVLTCPFMNRKVIGELK